MKKFLFATALIGALVGCGGGESDPVYNVSYELTGTAVTVGTTYQNASGGTEQTTEKLPATIGPFVSKPGDFLYMSAQNNTNTGNVTVTIKINGTVFKTATSSAAYGIASASGSCCGQ